MKKPLFLLFFIFLFFFIFPKVVQAEVLLWDDFNDGDANDGKPIDWIEFSGPGGNWIVENGQYIGTVVKPCDNNDIFSYALAGDAAFSDHSFTVKVNGVQGVDKKIMFRYQSNGTRYDVNLIKTGSINLQKWIDYSSSFLSWQSFNNSNENWYTLRVEAIGNEIKVFVDDQKLIDVVDSTDPLLTGKIGLQVWPGAYAGCGGWDKTKTTTRFDDILVCDFEGPCVMPTPTPTPIPLQPLILLPGLGASWNHEAMILGMEKEPEDWYITPGVKVYDGLIQTLKNAGYILNENLFIFNYDWRKPIEEIANDLKDYIGRHPPPPETEIDLVGHSLGGLVARTYVQENSDANVDQLITIGSPHKGAVKVYYLWEGAELSKGLSGWQRIGVGILLQLKKKGFENNVETIQQVVPVLKDILPTFPYLKINGDEKPISEMKQRNSWLNSLNQPPLPNPLISILNTIVGVKENSTLRWINAQERNRLDELLGKWIDGKPISEEYNTGDDTVLDFSASFEGAGNAAELPGLNHGDLVETVAGQQALINLLGLPPDSIEPAPAIVYEPSLVFQLASSVNMTIYGPDGWQIGEGVENNIPNATYSPNDELIFIPGAAEGDYEIHITPEGNGGAYRLLVGLLTESGDYWKEFAGRVEAGSTNIHQFWIPSTEQTEAFILLNQAKTEIFDLKKYFNREKVPPKLQGKIESKLAIIMGRINSALELLKEGKLDKAKGKISQAISVMNELQAYINSSVLPDQTKNLLIEPLEEIRDFLLRAYEFS